MVVTEPRRRRVGRREARGRNEVIGPEDTSSSQASSPDASCHRIIAWSRSRRWRPADNDGTAASMIATVSASSLVRSALWVSIIAIFQAEGPRAGSRRRCGIRPTRLRRAGRAMARASSRERGKPRSPRRMRRTVCRLQPVRRTICFITPWAASARTDAFICCDAEALVLQPLGAGQQLTVPPRALGARRSWKLPPPNSSTPRLTTWPASGGSRPPDPNRRPAGPRSPQAPRGSRIPTSRTSNILPDLLSFGPIAGLFLGSLSADRRQPLVAAHH